MASRAWGTCPKLAPTTCYRGRCAELANPIPHGARPPPGGDRGGGPV